MTAPRSQDPTVAALADPVPEETAHLLRSPENARRLRAAVDRLEHGGGATHDLVAPSP